MDRGAVAFVTGLALVTLGVAALAFVLALNRPKPQIVVIEPKPEPPKPIPEPVRLPVRPFPNIRENAQAKAELARKLKAEFDAIRKEVREREFARRIGAASATDRLNYEAAMAFARTQDWGHIPGEAQDIIWRINPEYAAQRSEDFGRGTQEFKKFVESQEP